MNANGIGGQLTRPKKVYRMVSMFLHQINNSSGPAYRHTNFSRVVPFSLLSLIQ